MPKVSVVIPAFNAGRFIGETLAAVRAQTLTDWEVIVVDNYSSDDTAAVARAVSDERIKVVQFRNGGVIAASRNEGARLAQGEWLAFLDADDLWQTRKLERCFAMMAHGVAMMAHGLRYFGADRDSWAVSPPDTSDCGLRQLLFARRNPIGTSSVLLKRDAFVAVGGFRTDDDLVTVEDWDLWLRVAEAGYRIQCLSEVLGDYRLHAASTGVSSGPDRQLRAGLTALERHFAILPRPGVGDYLLRQRKAATFYYTAGRKLHDAGRFADAWKYYTRALRLYPISLHVLAAVALLMLRVAPRSKRKGQECIS